jgi:hypothetical protein
MADYYPSVQFAKLKLILQAKIVAVSEFTDADSALIQAPKRATRAPPEPQFCAKLNR